MSNSYWTKRVRRIRRYDEAWSTDETNLFARKLALTYVHEIRDETTRVSLASYLAGDDFRALCDFSPSYERLSPEDCARVRQVTALYSKRADLELGVDRRAAAIEKFLEAERRCKATNQCLRSWSRGEFQFPPRVERVLLNAQRKIAKILGPVPDLTEIKFRFGPGATTVRTKSQANARYKLGDPFACSEAMLPLAGEFLAEFPGWVGLSESVDSVTVPIEIHHGKAGFVPKTAKEERIIVVEPLLNTLFQLGVGDHIAARLRRFGVDIRDQSRNQVLAKFGSMTGLLATLDLSSASDTISRELVAHLLPLDWYSFLSFGRTPVIELDGTLIRQEKFSSMGNGYTFPLETLIFYALAVSCCESYEEVSYTRAYGDDLIIPSWRFRLLSDVLVACGFVVNPKKSFYFGGFRESCGKDYLLGVDIRPFYLKDRLDGQRLFELHNFLVRRGDLARARLVRKTIAEPLVLIGPDNYGDGHLLPITEKENQGMLRPHGRKLGWSGYLFDTYASRKRTTVRVSKGDYVLPVYNVYVDEPTRLFTSNWDFPEECPEGAAWSYTRTFELRISPGGDSKVNYTKGKLKVTLPGTDGYKRISIYTLG